MTSSGKVQRFLENTGKYKLEVFIYVEGLSPKEHYRRHLNEASEMRKKKYLCSKETEVSKFKYFPNEEAEQNYWPSRII